MPVGGGRAPRGEGARPPGQSGRAPREPVLVQQLQEGQIRYAGMSADGLIMTGPEFFFAEQPLDVPGKGRGFLVKPVGEGRYAIERYRLRNEADKVTYDFENVGVEHFEGIWVISKAGKRQIRRALEARFGRKLSKIGD